MVKYNDMLAMPLATRMKDEHIGDLKKTWDELGKDHPFGAILSPWWNGRTADEFFDTGKREIKEVMKRVESIEEEFSDVSVPRKRALDFGCGIGRLTQALADYFDEVHGVDVALSMIEKANEYNSHGDKCVYHLNESEGLGLFPDDEFDFIYSSVTLMHMEPKYAVGYMQELLRVLEPSGILMFQYLSRPKLDLSEGASIMKVTKHLVKITTPEAILHSVRRMRYDRIKHETNEAVIEMYWMRRKKVERLLEKSGARVLDVEEERTDWPGWISCKYSATKQ